MPRDRQWTGKGSPGRVVGTSRDGPPQITEVDPLQPPTQESTLLEEYQALVLAEKECVQSVRDMEREVKEITDLPLGRPVGAPQCLLLLRYHRSRASH